ncbi:hypothetical protein [Mesorhizobium sp. KR9-304]|uniref:hypothetical protein n=1 Tax=Mesorhizobium sp. KR9-304 TaxID=3156614 RepID=UPI0032B36FAD
MKPQYHVDALRDLVAATIAASPYELDGFSWCALPQPEMAAKIGCSVETVRRIIRKPPFVRRRRKNITLVREGVPGPVTNYDRAQIMSSIWRKVTGKRTTIHEFHCLLGLAGEWPEGLQITLFKIVLWDWPFFMSAVKHHIDMELSVSSLEGKEPTLKKRFFAFPSITVMRRFAFLALEIAVDHSEQVDTMLAEMNAVEHGKPVPTWCKAHNPEAWKYLSGLS